MQAISNEIQTDPSQPEVQQEPVIYLLLEETCGRKCGISGLPIPAPSQPSQTAHKSRAEADPGYASPESYPQPDWTVAASETTQLRPQAWEPVPRHAEAGHVSKVKEEKRIQPQVLPANGLSGSALTVDVDVHGKIADLVDDKHLVLGQDPALVRQAVLKIGFHKLLNKLVAVDIVGSERCWAAARLRAEARWVLPTPGGPRNTTFPHSPGSA